MVAAGCGANIDDTDQPAESGAVTVLAAASLTEPFEAMTDAIKAESDLSVVYSFGPSSGLVEQIVAGAPADVVATADARTMRRAVDNGVISGDPTLFARNTLVLIVPAGNPGSVTGITDLAREELRIALCEPQVPCGNAAEQVLDAASVHAAADTYANDVSQATALVTLGEADAALVYLTNAVAAGDDVETIDVPEAADVVNEYYVGVVDGASNPAGAEMAIAQITGQVGRKALSDAGFALP